jgi:hypothetical protein
MDHISGFNFYAGKFALRHSAMARLPHHIMLPEIKAQMNREGFYSCLVF